MIQGRPGGRLRGTLRRRLRPPGRGAGLSRPATFDGRRQSGRRLLHVGRKRRLAEPREPRRLGACASRGDRALEPSPINLVGAIRDAMKASWGPAQRDAENRAAAAARAALPEMRSFA